MTKNEFEEWKDNNRNDFAALINFANDNGCEECVDDIISADMVDDFVRERMDNGGWQGVACCISDIINNMNDDFYRVDGYANLTTLDDWDMYADEIERNMDFDEIRCDECGEPADCVQGTSDWLDDDDLVKELGITDEEKDKLLEDDDYNDRCIDCFKKLVAEMRESEE